MRTKKGVVFLAAVLAVTLSGCGMHISLFPDGFGGKKQTAASASTVTTVPEEPQPTPVPVEANVTPKPTSTPAPRRIGTKTSTAKYIYFTNSMEYPIRELYLRVTNTEDWGKNQIPSESSVKSRETAQLFYSPTGESEVYDIRVVDRVGNSFALYSLNFADLQSGDLRIQDDVPYFFYMSLSSNIETRNDYTEVLARNYTADTNKTSGDDGWEVYNYDENGSSSGYHYDSSGNILTPDGQVYDPAKDYSKEYRGNTNYGEWDSYGNWISYY